jgi:hypothetical protein
MKFIKLTSAMTSRLVYINIDFIGHLNDVPEKVNYGVVEEKACTIVGVTTHNNGGFRVKESIEQILKMIEKSK